MSDFAEFNLNGDVKLKTYVNLLHSMLSRIQSAILKVKQLFTKNYVLLLHITLFLVYFTHINLLL